MKNWMKLMGLLLSLTVIMAACSSGGGGSDDDDRKQASEEESDDENKGAVEAARAAWPAYTGDADDTIDLSTYSVVTLIPFVNLTDNSQDEEAGEEFVEEVEDRLLDRYDGVFTTVRVADAPLGQADEVVVRGQVYDYSKSGYSYWTGRSKAKFKAEVALENGQTGALLKSSQVREDSRSDSREELLEEGAHDLAKMLSQSKG